MTYAHATETAAVVSKSRWVSIKYCATNQAKNRST